MLTKLSRDTTELQVVMGKWEGLNREERKCAKCNSGKCEDAKAPFNEM